MATALNFDAFLPEGQSLKDYQHVGVAYALVAASEAGKGAFICDEQGLGKTRQAIVAAKVRGARRTLVICKASLRGNWLREYSVCAPELSTQLLAGPLPFAPDGQVCIIAFDSLAAWGEALAAYGFDALIVDESHYVKNLGTKRSPVKRSVAALALADAIRARNGLVLALTGTPVLNRPIELITQLQLIGRLHDVTPQPYRNPEDEASWEYAFKFAYCGATKTGQYWEFKGANNLELLNLRLRECGYVRRLRHDVLNLSETNRIEIPLTLNGALDDYRRAEKSYELAMGTDEAQTPGWHLVQLTRLRELAGEAKVGAAVEWIDNFLDENPGKKLVVFAWHVSVQKAIAKATGGIYLAGSKDIEKSKADFNEGDARVIVCSLQAHREGHTLVGDGMNVTDVLFVENPWHAGAKSQAEDRINRIGRQAEAVFAWTLLAAEADIDVWLNELVESKRVVATGAADGVDATEPALDVRNELIRRFTEKKGV
jgi:SWI/SNF-related matrix-associated actin-dependent regulator 1 of chromatin subfamily A